MFLEKIYQSETVIRLKRRPTYSESPGWIEQLGGPVVSTGRALHRPVHGKVDAVREVAEDNPTAVRCAEIDAERAAINRRLAELSSEEQQLLRTAFQTARPITVKELKQG